VVDGRAAKVHASGHAQAEELKLMLNLTRPRYFMPIHGATRQLVRHGELARELGWSEENVFVLTNGRPLRLTEGGAEVEEPVISGRKLVDGNRLGEPEDPVLQSRLKLAGGGLVVVTVVLTAEGELALEPRVAIRGVHYENDLDLSMEAAATATAAVSNWRGEAGEMLDEEALSATIQREVRQLFRHSISRRPSIWPQIIFLPEPAQWRSPAVRN
jgi:ribonuclease J